uniref:Uncharacterized protein n=1 Tax=Chromera velia CCMP2878 TaxID=1169474 RepID=A0A0G4I2E8_9ALVE|eukprot:Cvel_10373.t1-p1 / transcript=Cvel_10373.t1 / gene=Cvel_10373 / organism=Chromera_velia_CCMP2878 / gene_product=hypothetical protein / transcript_product=hypothetical protein / location=Cvel_scaffold624:68063-68719(+) / protein_length=219 / sequence_SO=supercontig / SO=protein_coding / is_pseudo=false
MMSYAVHIPAIMLRELLAIVEGIDPTHLQRSPHPLFLAIKNRKAILQGWWATHVNPASPPTVDRQSAARSVNTLNDLLTLIDDLHDSRSKCAHTGEQVHLKVTPHSLYHTITTGLAAAQYLEKTFLYAGSARLKHATDMAQKMLKKLFALATKGPSFTLELTTADPAVATTGVAVPESVKSADTGALLAELQRRFQLKAIKNVDLVGQKVLLEFTERVD